MLDIRETNNPKMLEQTTMVMVLKPKVATLNKTMDKMFVAIRTIEKMIAFLFATSSSWVF